MQVGAVGRLSTSEQFGDIVVRTDPVKGSIVLLKDVARIELGALRYTSSAFFGDRPTIGLAIYQAAGSNAVELKENVKAKMDELAKRFPPGIAYAMHYDTTRFVSAATRDVLITLGQALVLVVIVVFVFLQSWRTTIIPVIAIPVSLIATLVVMKLMGFSLNMLSLLGMVLAIRLVVDDAIVVVENAKLARSGEGCPVLVDKCFERRRRPTTNRFDQVVRAGEDPVLVVDGDLAQVLHGERIARPAVWCLFKLAVQRSGVVSGRRLLPSGGHHLEHGLKAYLLVLNFFSEHAAENIGDPLVGELDRTVQRVSLAAVLTGVLQNPHDNARLVLSGNWRMTAGAEGHVEQPGADHGREIQQPLCEIRWPQVYDR